LLSLSGGIFYLNINEQAAWESDFSLQPVFYRRGIVKWWMANKAKNAANLLFLCGMCAILTIAQKRK